MKRTFAAAAMTAAVAAILFVWSAGACAKPSRIVENLNRDWRFVLEDVADGAVCGLDESGWERVNLPHSFSMPYFMSKDFYEGYGWYRKHISLPVAGSGERTFLEFDGVFQEAEVFVNGRRAGSHVGGYTGFSIDITEYLRPGDNLIAVRVNNLWRPDVAPRAGEHVFSGGIYRNVRLVTKPEVHVDWYGTFVTTPGLAQSHGATSAVAVETTVCNSSAKDLAVRIVSEVVSPEGKTVAAAKSSVRVAAGAGRTVGQQTGTIADPQLWSPENPVLYNVRTKLYDGKKLIDEYETAFGFRWFDWLAESGFSLNGRHRYLKGVNVHQDQAGWGDAVTDAAARRDVAMMKEAGFDFIRGSHYPHSPAFSEACDELGMLLWSETPFWGIGGHKGDGYWNSSAYPVRKEDEAAFEESALRQLEEMIRIHRNHPSVVAWSMCNEAFFSSPVAMPGVRRLLGRMVDRSHKLDNTRVAAIGGAQRPLGDGRIDKIGDIAGYNGDGATQPDFIDPGIPSIVSEYGSTTADRPGEYSPGWGDLKKDGAWRGRQWRGGQSIWCGFDHGSIAGSALGKMGIVDYFRIPKRAWYWYRNEYGNVAPPEWSVEGTPARLALSATKTAGVGTDGTDDVHLTVTVLDSAGRHLSNSPEVTLTVVSGPGEFPTGRSIRFEEGSDIRIMDGMAGISMRSYLSGKSVVEATSPGLEPATVEIEFSGDVPFREGDDSRVPDRPYRRYVRAAEGVSVFGPNNPVFASSRHPEHTAGNAADADGATYWAPDEGDASPWIMLDTEKRLRISAVEIMFPSEMPDAYTVETSVDGTVWRKVELKNVRTLGKNTVAADTPNAEGRFVRISFPGADRSSGKSRVGVSEIKVKGTIQQ